MHGGRAEAVRQAAFETRRLRLRPAAASDLEDLWLIWRDPDVRRYLFDDLDVTREAAADALADCLDMGTRGLGLWMVAGLRDFVTVGCVGLLETRKVAECAPYLAGKVEVLGALTPSVWGLGYANEGLTRLIAYASDSLGLAELVAVCDVPNEASNRMVLRLGFAPTGECDGPRHRMRTYRRPLTSGRNTE